MRKIFQGRSMSAAGRSFIGEQVKGILLSPIVRPLRFCCTGGLAALFQLSVLSVLLRCGWPDLPANSAAFLLSAQLNFLLSTLFTWHDRPDGRKRLLLIRWLAFHGSIAGTGLLNILIFLAARTLLPTMWASALGIGCAACANFFLFNRLVFRGRKGAPSLKTRQGVGGL